MSSNVPFPLPQDRRHTQPVVDMFRYAPPVEQTPYAEAAAAEKQKKDNSKSDAASVASTSTFASTKALLKNKFGRSSRKSYSKEDSKEADKKRAAEQAKILESTVKISI